MVVAILQAVALTALSVPSVAVAQSNGYKWSSLLQLCPTAYFATLCIRFPTDRDISASLLAACVVMASFFKASIFS